MAHFVVFGLPKGTTTPFAIKKKNLAGFCEVSFYLYYRTYPRNAISPAPIPVAVRSMIATVMVVVTVVSCICNPVLKVFPFSYKPNIDYFHSLVKTFFIFFFILVICDFLAVTVFE